MAKVFISYSNADRKLAQEIHDWLVADGHRPFLDYDRLGGCDAGEDWQSRLLDELRRADALVPVVTAAFLESPWCITEVATAHEQGKRLLPLAAGADPAAVPLLGRVQYLHWLANRDNAVAKLAAALRALDTGGARGVPDGRSPYPGLDAFDRETAWAFVGREAEVRALADLLRSPALGAEGRLVAVVGPSGCGKSSLVRAGLVPAMLADPGWWALPPVLPGTDPVAALAGAFTECGRDLGLPWTVEEVARRLATGPTGEPTGEPTGAVAPDPGSRPGLAMLAGEVLAAAPVGHRNRLLIVIDQFEELLTRAAPSARVAFSSLLAPALRGPVRVAAPLRPEFVGTLQESGELRRLPVHSFLLSPLAPAMLPVVVNEPARRAGIEVPRELVDRLVADTAGGDALLK